MNNIKLITKLTLIKH